MKFGEIMLGKRGLKGIKWKWVWGIIAVWAVVCVVGTGISIWSYGERDEKQDADVIIVLGAAAYEGEVSPVFRERLNHGVRLYEEGYAEKMILTGGVGEGSEYSDAYMAKQYVVELGVPEEAVLLEEKSTITQENLENAKELMDSCSYRTAIIVSDPLHMKRSMLIAEDCGITAYSSPTPTTRYQTMKSKFPFLAREEFFYIGYRIYRILK